MRKAFPAAMSPATGRALIKCRALPILAQAFVIAEGGFGRDRCLRRAWIGAQPQIGAEDIAVSRALLHDVDEIAGESDKKRGGFGTCGQAARIAVSKR